MRGIDVHQDKGDPDWTKVKAAGYGFAWLKVSEGVGFPATDDWYRRNRAASRSAGLRVGGYHYLTTKGGGSSPSRRRRSPSHASTSSPATCCPSATTSRSRPTATRQLPSSRRSRRRSASGRSSTPTPTTWTARAAPTTSGASRAWLASYGPNDGKLHAPSVPAGFRLVAHQLTSKGSIPGGVCGDVDLNELLGDDLDRITHRRSQPTRRTVVFELVHSGEVVRSSAAAKPGSVRERLTPRRSSSAGRADRKTSRAARSRSGGGEARSRTVLDRGEDLRLVERRDRELRRRRQEPVDEDELVGGDGVERGLAGQGLACLGERGANLNGGAASRRERADRGDASTRHEEGLREAVLERGREQQQPAGSESLEPGEVGDDGLERLDPVPKLRGVLVAEALGEVAELVRSLGSGPPEVRSASSRSVAPAIARTASSARRRLRMGPSGPGCDVTTTFSPRRRR